MSGTLVGRAGELAALAAVAAAGAASGRPVSAFVIGAAGMGKSRLLQEAAGVFDADVRISLVGYELERSVPLGAARPLIAATESVPTESSADGQRTPIIGFRKSTGTIPSSRTSTFTLRRTSEA